MLLHLTLLATLVQFTTSQTNLLNGVRLHRQGDYTNALLNYETGIKQNSQCADCHHLTGLIHFNQGRVEAAIQSISQAIQLQPSTDNFYNSLGEVYRQNEQYERAVIQYQIAIDLNTASAAATTTNTTNTTTTTPTTNSSSRTNSPTIKRNPEYHNNMGLVLLQMSDSTAACFHFEQALLIQPDHFSAGHNLGLSYRNIGQYDKSIATLKQLLRRAPHDSDAQFHLAISHQMAGQLVEARVVYRHLLMAMASSTDAPDEERRDAIHINLGAIYQESGEFINAIELYNKVLVNKPDDPRALNNLGSSLWQLGDAEQSINAYQLALQSDSSSPEPYVNLGVALYEYGDVEGATEMYEKALALGGGSGLKVRVALLMKPIMSSNDNIQHVRDQFKVNIQRLIAEPLFVIKEPVKDIERLHFYMVYHGYNEYQNQIMMAKLYLSSTPHLQWISPWLSTAYDDDKEEATTTANNRNKRTRHHTSTPFQKIRIGFVSKFLVVNHAHGQLLEGIVAYLPREQFEIVICAIPNPQQTILPSMTATANQIVHLSFSLKEARMQMADLQLDVLVFADMMSEPLTYFLGLGSRIAPVQCLFWGNPVTSGSENIDYFISGEHMEEEQEQEQEHDQEHLGNAWRGFNMPQYSEQVIRLKGQGIWYDQVPVPLPSLPYSHTYGTIPIGSDQDNHHKENHHAHTIHKEWTWLYNDSHQRRADIVVYICPQSSFKLHPDFDTMLIHILKRVPQGHLVLLKGRRETWTEMVQQRMQTTFAAHTNINNEVWRNRVHFVSRVSGSDNFINLLQLGDVVLHPFPFGGSKTSADALAAGLPLVVLKGQSLRGRMAYSFFVTMDMYDTVANNKKEYEKIAVRLGLDQQYRLHISTLISKRNHLIWERMSVVDAWANFLQKAHTLAHMEKRLEEKEHRIIQYNRRSTKVTVVKEVAKEVSGGDKMVAHHHNATATSNSDVNQQLLYSAQTDYKRGDVASAQKKYEQLLSTIPPTDVNYPNICNDLGAVHKQANQLLLAKQYFLLATTTKPDYVTGLNNLGVVYQEMGLYQDASREYQKVLDLSPNHSGASYNLGNLYRDIGRYDQAIVLLKTQLNVNYKGWSIICLLALFDGNMFAGSELFEERFGKSIGNALWEQLDPSFRARGAALVLSERNRIQLNYLDAANSLMKFNTKINALGFIEQSKQVYSLVRFQQDQKRKANTATAPPPPPVPPSTSSTEFHVITQYYHAASIHRQKEINECLQRNLALPSVAQVHVLTERMFSFNASIYGVYQHKLIQHVVGQRLTFQGAFEYCNVYLSGHVCSVANADIYFNDASIQNLLPQMKRRTVYATVRWDVAPSKTTEKSTLSPRIDSQDSWIFQSPMKVTDIGFEIGRLRSDNRIAAQLMEAQYRVINNPWVVITHHLQSTELRPGRTNVEQIPGKTTNVLLTMEM